MLKFILNVFFLFFCCFIISSQEKQEKLDYYFQKGSSYLYTDIDSTKYYFKKATKISEEIDDLGYYFAIRFYSVQAAGYHYDLEFFKSNLNQLDSVIKSGKSFDTIHNKSVYIKNFLVQNGNYLYKTRNFNLAKDNFQELIRIISKNNMDSIEISDRKLLSSSYNYLASINEKIGKTESAKELYNTVFSLWDQYDDEKSLELIFGAKMRLAGVYEKEKNYTQANRLLNEALAYYKSNKDNPRLKNNLLSIHQRLSKNYLLQDSISKALSMIKENEQYYVSNDAFERSADLLYGDIYLTAKKYTLAETYYKKYLVKIKEYRNKQKHQDVAEAYARLGKLCATQNRFDESLEFYQLALSQLQNDFEDKNSAINPKPSLVISKLELLKTLKQKLELLEKAFKESGDIKYLEIGNKASQSFVNTLDLLKPEFESKVDKQFLISEMYPAFNAMVAMSYELYVKTKDTKYSTDAFYYIEKSKSILLLESVRNAQANTFGDIPVSVIDQEQQYRAKIIHLEKQIFNQRVVKGVSESLFDLKNRYYTFIKGLEQQYPKYYKLKYKNEVTDIAVLQKNLNSDRAVVSYFSTSDQLYSITIDAQNTKFQRIDFDQETRNEIISFYTQLSKPRFDQIDMLNKLGMQVYEAILQKPLQNTDVTKLTIIPDDVLNYIPFDVLSFSTSPDDYLVKKYQISYANSVTIMSEAKSATKNKGRLIAFAPKFGEAKQVEPIIAERGDFGPLLYNMEEAKNVASYFEGNTVLGDEASIASFRNRINDYTILHFATHAAANDENPDYSYLAFASKSDTLDLLYVKDLYGYTINADLVTLSACQTGIGKLQKGEGMLSLARGFNYAGAKSLVTTLWKINDQTTSELMDGFYNKLSEGKSKDDALRSAKLNYLNTVEDDMLKHPYYWAGFMLTGDTSTLVSQTFVQNYGSWLLLLLIPVLLFVILKWRKNSKSTFK